MKPILLFFLIFFLFTKAQTTRDGEFLLGQSTKQLSKETKILLTSENDLNQNLFKESMNSLFQAKKMSETSDSEYFRAYTYILLSGFYRGLELNKKASDHIEMAINSLSSIKDPKEKNDAEARFLLEKGLLNFAASKNEEGKIDLWKSKSRYQQVKNPEIAVQSLQSINSKLGDYYLSRNELDSAKHYYSQNLKLSNQFPSYQDLDLRAKNGFSKYYLQKKQPDSALYFVSGFSKVLPEIKDIRLKRDVYKNLAQVYYSANDLENYKSSNENYLKLNDSIYELDKDARVVLANQVENSKTENPDSDNLLWILIILVFALAGLALTYAHHRKVKKEYAQFQKIMRQLNAQETI